MRLIVPPGALTDSTFITATVPEGDNTSVHFEPSGLVLKKSAALVFDAATCDVSAWFPPNVVYFVGGEILEWIDAEYIPHLQTVAAPIDHFSGYALAM